MLYCDKMMLYYYEDKMSTYGILFKNHGDIHANLTEGL